MLLKKKKLKKRDKNVNKNKILIGDKQITLQAIQSAMNEVNK